MPDRPRPRPVRRDQRTSRNSPIGYTGDMGEPEPSWDLYRTFLAVLTEGSLSAAGRALGLTQPTVGRHVEELEQLLGTALFTRAPTGLTPTEAARRVRPHAETLAATAQALRRSLAGDGSTAARVRLTCSEVMGVEVLPAILHGLREAHPEVVVELVLSNAVDDLLNRSADVAVRMTQPRQGALLCRRVGTVRLGLYGHRSYLDRHGTPAEASDLGRHALVGFDRETPFVRAALAMSGLPVRRADFAFCADSDLAQLAAVRAGLGLGFVQVELARRDPALVRVLAGRVEVPLPTWVAMHEDLGSVPAFRATFDALAVGLLRYIGGA